METLEADEDNLCQGKTIRQSDVWDQSGSTLPVCLIGHSQTLEVAEK